MTTAFLTLGSTSGESSATARCVRRDHGGGRERRAEAGLLIHEGQLTYGGVGSSASSISASGGSWRRACRFRSASTSPGATSATTLPGLSDVLRDSIGRARAPRGGARVRAPVRPRAHAELADKFVGMYVNELTEDYGDEGARRSPSSSAAARKRAFERPASGRVWHAGAGPGPNRLGAWPRPSSSPPSAPRSAATEARSRTSAPTTSPPSSSARPSSGAGVPAGEIEDVYFGAANQAGEDNRNVARMAALLAGLPQEVAGVTVNRLCASGCRPSSPPATPCAGDGELFVAGGVESMSRAPLVMGKPEHAYPRGNQTVWDTTLGWRFLNPRMEEMFPLESMGETGENVAERFEVARGAGRLRAREPAAACGCRRGRPLRRRARPGRGRRRDEHPRPDTSAEKLAALKPAFARTGRSPQGTRAGSTTAQPPSSSPAPSERRSRRRAARPLRRGAVAGVDPRIMGIGPVPGRAQAARPRGVEAGDPTSSSSTRRSPRRASGSFASSGSTREGERQRRRHRHRPPARDERRAPRRHAPPRAAPPGGRYGLATLCVGVGQGQAALFER